MDIGVIATFVGFGLLIVSGIMEIVLYIKGRLN
jgi:hypothetical protein